MWSLKNKKDKQRKKQEEKVANQETRLLTIEFRELPEGRSVGAWEKQGMGIKRTLIKIKKKKKVT